MKTPTWFQSARTLATLATLATLTAPASQAHAEPAAKCPGRLPRDCQSLYAFGLGRIEARLELVGQPYELRPLLIDAPVPTFWMGLTTSIGTGKGVRVGVAARFDLDKHTDAFEVLAELGWSAVAGQSIVPPLFTYGATLAIGGRTRKRTEVTAIAREAAPEIELRVEAGIVLFEDFRLLLGVGAMFAFPQSGPAEGQFDFGLRTSLIGAVTF